MTTNDSWEKGLESWLKRQHGTAGWEQKLENFIRQTRREAVKEFAKEVKKFPRPYLATTKKNFTDFIDKLLEESEK